MSTPDRSPLHKAIRLAGGPSAVARHFEISPAAISRWLKKGKPPGNRCIRLEELVNRKVTRYELDPEVFGAPPRKNKSARLKKI